MSGSVCDLESEADRKDLANKVSTVFNGKLDILVNPLFLSLNISSCFSILMTIGLKCEVVLILFANWKEIPLLTLQGQ